MPTRRFLCVLALPLLLSAAAPPAFEAKPAADLDALFRRENGWIGADGAYSVATSPQRTLWLYSDTWIGEVRDGKRTNATIVNNTVGVQQGHGAKAKVEFVHGRTAEGKPAALITPADGRGWFWLQACAFHDGRLLLFLAQIEKTGDPGVFGFRQIGTWLGVVPNPEQHPSQWKVDQKRVPFALFEKERTLAFGAATLLEKDTLYVYGIDEPHQKGRLPDKHLILARVPIGEATDFTAWRFFQNGEWVATFEQAGRLAGGCANELAVVPQPSLGGFAAVYTDRGMSPRIVLRTAAKPWGPWSEPVEVYRCPEAQWDKRIFCYAGKAHPALAADGNEIVVSYATNSFDFWHVAADARLYWPRFVRVQWKP